MCVLCCVLCVVLCVVCCVLCVVCGVCGVMYCSFCTHLLSNILSIVVPSAAAPLIPEYDPKTLFTTPVGCVTSTSNTRLFPVNTVILGYIQNIKNNTLM